MASRRLSQRAERELVEQIDYLLEHADDPTAAIRLEADFERVASMYAGNPGLGSRDVADDPDLRAFLFGTPSNRRGWIAFYRATGDGIEILRVFRGSRDFDSLL